MAGTATNRYELITMLERTYIDTEFKLFSHAKNWKRYIRQLLRKSIKGSVLEVGAGLGSNTCLLSRSNYTRWLCLESDLNLFQTLELSIAANKLAQCRAEQGTIDVLNHQQRFDSILYLNVLEQIFDDRKEMIEASSHLNRNGHLIVLAPADRGLYTPFDKAIDRYRCYSKRTLKSLLPDDIKIERLMYLDCIGWLASLTNQVFLKQSKPTLKQLKTWDSLMVPISTKLDPIIGYNLGRSVLLIAKKR